MVNRVLALAYGVVSYAAAFTALVYAVGFIGNFGVPKAMDSGPSGPLYVALSVDLALLALFAVQHSVMARPGFKRLLTRVLPAAVERSTYVLASGVALLLLYWQWRPLGGVIWDIHSDFGRAALHVGSAFGWVLLLATTFVINHFDLFGLRQVWRNLLGLDQRPLQFVTPMLYRIVRHPLYVGWLFAVWCAPTMTVTHLVFAAATTAYILVAVRFEERDLMRAHPEYRSYRRAVPMLVPRLARARAAKGGAGVATRG